MVNVNKKIRNATVVKSNKITFKSMLEKMCYNTLLEQGFTPITPYYDEESKNHLLKRREQGDKTPRKLVQKNSKIIGIRYTCDFYIKYEDLDIWIEVKSIENDVFYIKKKMFLKYLDNLYNTTGQKSMYFEVHSKKQLLQMIEIVKEYGKISSKE